MLLYKKYARYHSQSYRAYLYYHSEIELIIVLLVNKIFVKLYIFLWNSKIRDLIIRENILFRIVHTINA
ncbi:hypothetical protein CPJCM30710_09990 [Clostridium polyendosporum]|uniref:Uncharacterized protein n=1 Tax=Clostridium polyendosporum TaxID=69208 RepID=A0A919RZ97_9CLOT|nr:hypothetical protein CPJCM30710_09990 [Clostridium polyendosporum]